MMDDVVVASGGVHWVKRLPCFGLMESFDQSTQWPFSINSSSTWADRASITVVRRMTLKNVPCLTPSLALHDLCLELTLQASKASRLQDHRITLN